MSAARDILARIFKEATDAFEAGAIGERELLAIGMAVNDEMALLPNAAPISAINAAELRKRVAELS